MKLLFDQNLSPKLVKLLADIYPSSSHVHLIGLDQADDEQVWRHAQQEGYLIVTKDSDFNDLCLLLGFPPQIIWIRRGNCRVVDIEKLLRDHYKDIKDLVAGNENGVIILF